MITQIYPPEYVVRELLAAPFKYGYIVPNILPIVAGLLVMEFYFGKHKHESLGWNTAVGNSLIWAATGLSLIYINESLTATEYWLTLGLVAAGGTILYMDFYHLWPRNIAFRISSSSTVYLIAYVTVVLIESPLPVNQSTLTGSAVFVIGALTVLKIGKSFMTPVDRGPGDISIR